MVFFWDFGVWFYRFGREEEENSKVFFGNAEIIK